MSPVFSHYCIYSNCHREEAKYDDDAENIKGDDEYDENDATYLYVLYQTWQA